MIKFIKKIFNKLKHSLVGIYILFKEENSFFFYGLWLIVLIVIGVIFNLSILDWILIIIAFTLTVVTEILNTSIENLADHISLQYNTKLKKVKDLSAAATLVMLIFSLIIDLLVFIPAIINFFS